MLSIKAKRNQVHVFGMIRLGIEPRSPGLLANTLTIEPTSGTNESD